MTESIRENLKRQMDVCDWQMLVPSFTRGVIVVVSSNLDLLDVGVAIGEDKADYVKKLMEENKIQNANDEHHKKWLQMPEQKFQMIVVAPYILIQELVLS